MTTAERIADFAFKASFDKDVSELEKLLQAQGATTRVENDTLFINKANYGTGLILGCDPITALAIIIMALWTPRGMLLPEAREAFRIVNKQGGERVKLAKQVKEPIVKINESEQLTFFRKI